MKETVWPRGVTAECRWEQTGSGGPQRSVVISEVPVTCKLNKQTNKNKGKKNNLEKIETKQREEGGNLF